MFSEYRDMFFKCQNDSSPYYMVTIDITHSKQYKGEARFAVQLKLRSILEAAEREGYCTVIGYRPEPIKGCKGDAIGISSKVANRKEVMEFQMRVLKLAQDSLGDIKFHYAGGYFETYQWVEGLDKYYSGYCFEELSNAHKPTGVGGSYIIKQGVGENLRHLQGI